MELLVSSGTNNCVAICPGYPAGWFCKRSQKSVSLFLAVFLSLNPNQSDIFALSKEHCTKISFAVACFDIGSALGRLDMKEK